METVTKIELNALLKSSCMEKIKAALSDEQLLDVGSAEIAFPVVDAEGNEKWVVVSVTVPNGSRDGTPYDGFSANEAYQEQVAKAKARKEKAAENSRKRKEEAERKKAEREAKKAQAEAEASAED